MFKQKLLSFTLLFLATFIVYGQETSRKAISGKLLPTTENLFLETIYVYNKQSGEGVLSNASGDFKLAMRLGDTIAISAMQVDSAEAVVEQMHLNDAFITMPIQASMEFLEEVRLSNRNLTGNLDLDMKLLPVEPVITSLDLGFAPLGSEISKGERMLSSYSSSPVELLMATITGDLKKIKRRIAIEKRSSKVNYVIKRMPRVFYINNLKVAQQDIPHFIEFCEAAYDLDNLVSMPINEFVEALQERVIAYKEVYPDREK